MARVDLSAESLDDSFVARRSPCKSSSGGCMGLDQALIQDADGTFAEREKYGDPDEAGVALPLGTYSSIIPFTPRTETVWSSQCTRTIAGSGLGSDGGCVEISCLSARVAQSPAFVDRRLPAFTISGRRRETARRPFHSCFHLFQTCCGVRGRPKKRNFD